MIVVSVEVAIRCRINWRLFDIPSKTLRDIRWFCRICLEVNEPAKRLPIGVSLTCRTGVLIGSFDAE